MSTINAASFLFRAQTIEGEAMSGTIQAASLDDANRRLAAMQLRVIQIDPAAPVPRAKPLRGEDFQTFNLQLAHLTTAGLPVEQSLRLIAQDMRSGRLAQTIRQVVAETESGASLAEAFDRHADKFPPLYGELVYAGVASGNLSGMLLNLGRHLDMVAKMRSALWRAISYPLFVVISLILVVSFLGVFVLPQFNKIFADFHTDLPGITEMVLSTADFVRQIWPALLIALALILIGGPLLWALVRRRGWAQAIVETLVFPLPLLGEALRRNLLARWCDALRLGVMAHADLPTAVRLAGDAVGSPAMRRAGRKIIAALEAGQPIEQVRLGRLIPPTVTAAIAFAAKSQDLPEALDTLSQMFQQQAELRTALIPVILMPALVIVVAVLIGIVVVAMFAPLISLIQSVSGPRYGGGAHWFW